MKRFVAMLGALIVCACAPMAPSVSPPPPVQTFARDEQPTAAAQTACTAAHGAYHQVGLMGSWVCITPMADAGKVCSSKGQCVGQCIYEGAHQPAPGESTQGRCQRTNVQFGCFSTVEGGRAQPPLCVD